ncbi:NAD-dependent epimerase/dehydratase family protein [Oceanibaculum pacificum]|uniref:NAD-dependent epimerase/dehydratase domain-containing protein n=1 Tax=Oceanibaculum pacificum TaxID=580166 RepID=A0A154VKU0_9PROT|nr:NAD-dependent epimerase/dehydratase family protein [Oceanibaculum pacificum]KZD01895.1 hypothetical protein AUP43_13675 [Oceanibaculum pacificum]
MTVLLTGANGFIGRAMARHFQALGRPVRGALRRPVALPEGVEPVIVGEIGPETDWTAALRGIDSVIHLAAPADQGALDEATLRRVTVAGGEALAAAARAAGVQRFLLLSSAKVMGEETLSGQRFRDSDTPRPVTAYARAKLAAEEAVLAAFPGALVLRPPLVYGPGVGGNFAKLLRLADIAPPPPFGGIDNSRAMLYLGNLVSAVERSLDSAEGRGQRFLLHDGAEISVSTLIRQLRLAHGRSPRLLPGGRTLVRLLAGRETARRLCGGFSLDSDRFFATFGWQPPFDVQHALYLTVSGQQL